MSDRDSAARPGELVPIASVYSQPEAAVLFATLRAYGFLAFRFDDDTLYVSPWWMVALGGIRIMVPRHQLEDAAALLAEIDAGWNRPPRPFADERWVSMATSLIIFFMCIGAPPPRIRGTYGWKAAQPESGSPAR